MTDKTGTYRRTGRSVAEAKFNLESLRSLRKQILKLRGCGPAGWRRRWFVALVTFVVIAARGLASLLFGKNSLGMLFTFGTGTVTSGTLFGGLREQSG